MIKNILKEKVIEFVEKKSRFIGYIYPVNSVEEANKYIEKIKKEHINATHNVPVYRVIENGQEYFKYNDDGEPSGTAGKPMADILERKGVYNVAMVATRYFGGIKLGAGGLIRNYARVSKELLESCELVDYVERKILIIIFDYSYKSIIDKILNDRKIEIIEQSFLDKVNIKVHISNEDLSVLKKFNFIEIIEV